MTKYHFKISLRLWHPTRELSVATDVFSLMPSRNWRAGDGQIDSKGQKLEGFQENNYWVAAISKGDADRRSLAAALESVVEELSSQSAFLTEFVADGGTAELFVGWFMNEYNTGDIINWRLSEKLAQLRLNLSIDLYSSFEE